MEGGGTGKGGIGGPSWGIWELGNWSAAGAAASSSTASLAYAAPSYAMASSSSSSNALSCSPFPDQALVSPGGAGGDHYQLLDYSRSQQQYHHHLTCLKLGKRPYYEEGVGVGVGAKRTTVGGAGAGAVPRCQVEGCGKALGDAKEYHRRHKVCEAHSKAPKVVVLGIEQRFCQQCSRFHVISEFDDSKRSCRRRLAGHNERRRKSTNDSIPRNPSLESMMLGSKFPYVSSTSSGRALSLLSSKASPLVPTSDLSSRSSAALRELIAENRAAGLAWQLFADRGWHGMPPEFQAVAPYVAHQNQVPSHAAVQLADGWNQTQVTLDLMQMPGSSLEMLPGRSKSKDEEEECCEIWKSLEGTHVV